MSVARRDNTGGAGVPDLPEIRDGDVVEFVFNGETLQGVAIVDGPVIHVESEAVGVVVPDQRFPILLLERAA
jgi:hypothetical protein